MINKIGTVCIFVADQERAREFYTRKMGMELRTDMPLNPGSTARWISVAPKGAQTELILYLPDENWEHYRQVVGKSQAVTLDVTDMAGLVKQLKAGGVKIVHEPDVQPWGTNAVIEDSEGNNILLVEQPKEG
jgi:catechol 2,3-dioxygenase-like lactoylglutathione lyase family enzyme